MKNLLLSALLFILISCGDNEREAFLKKTITAKYNGRVVVSVKETSAKESDNTGSIYCDVTFSDSMVKDTVHYSRAGDGIYTLYNYK